MYHIVVTYNNGIEPFIWPYDTRETAMERYRLLLAQRQAGNCSQGTMVCLYHDYRVICKTQI